MKREERSNIHAIVAVIHRPKVNIDNLFSRYLYDNIDYFEVEEEYDFGQVEDLIEKELEGYDPEEESNYRKTFCENLKNSTGLDRIRAYADWYGYDLKQDSIVRCGNPEGWCDWYVIGGRWENSLMDFGGNGHNSLRAQDIDLSNPNCLVQPYKVIEDYIGGYEMLDGEGDGFKESLQKAIKWSEANEQEVYVTIVDMHM